MATHSSILAWKFSWTEEPSGLQSMSSQRAEQLSTHTYINTGSPGGTVVKNPPANAGDARDMGSIPGLRGSLGVENGNPLQYSCLEIFMDTGAWFAIVHGVAKELDMT